MDEYVVHDELAKHPRQPPRARYLESFLAAAQTLLREYSPARGSEAARDATLREVLAGAPASFVKDVLLYLMIYVEVY